MMSPMKPRLTMHRSLVALLVLVTCCVDAADAPLVPDNAADATASVADPLGDGIRGTVGWDLTEMTLTRDASGITVTLELSKDVVSPMSGDPDALIGFVDLDLDQNASTGGISVVDEFRHDGGHTGLGVDERIDASSFGADSTVAVTDAAGAEIGRVKPAFRGRLITFHLPNALLHGDDGVLDAVAIVGSAARPDDFAPQSGHLSLGTTR